MNPVQIGFLVCWMIVVLVWIVYAYLNYSQVRPIIGLRPNVKSIFILQTIVAMLFFAGALALIFTFSYSTPSFL